MKKPNWDERQTFVNYRLSHHALMIVFGLLLINALIKSNFEISWADPISETIILIVIPGMYYITRSIFNDAYIGTKDTIRKNIISFLVLALIFGFSSIFVYDGPYIDGGLTQSTAPIITSGFFVYIAILHIIKRLKSTNE